MTAPTIHYARRAGINPEPVGYVHDVTSAHTTDDAAAWAAGEHRMAADTPHSFWADISEFQDVVTGAYPYQQLCIRLDTGYRLDNHALANHAAWLRMKRTGPLLGYPVFVPGQTKAALSRMRNAFGSHLEGIAPMVDMESGPGFAGPGNHSTEANDFVAELAAATGSVDRQIGYANGGDWVRCWPSHGPLRHRIVANYGSVMVSGFFAQQYYGGMNYPTPPGFPRSCAPFGSWVDLNAATATTPALLAALALTNTEDDMSAADVDAINKHDDQNTAKILAAIAAGTRDVDAHVAAALAGVYQKLGLVFRGDPAHPDNLASLHQAITDLTPKAGA